MSDGMDEQTVLKLLASIEEYASASAEIARAQYSEHSERRDRQNARCRYGAAEIALIETVAVSTGWKPVFQPGAVGPINWIDQHWTVTKQAPEQQPPDAGPVWAIPVS